MIGSWWEHLRKTLDAGSSQIFRLTFLVEKNLFHVFAEYTGDLECEGQAGVIAVILEGIDASAGNLRVHGKLCLGPFALGSEDAQASLHSWYPRRQ